MTKAVTLLVPSAEATELVNLISSFNQVEEVSEPAALEPGSVLNAGIGVEEIKTMLEFFTVILTTGTTLLTFLKALREEMKSRKGDLIITDPKSGSRLGSISGTTTDDEIQRIAN